jgi:hypothetical protein
MSTNQYNYLNDSDTTTFGSDDNYDAVPVEQWELADFADLFALDPA